MIHNIDQGDMGGTVEAGDEFGYSGAALGGNDEYEVTLVFSAPGENNDAGVVNWTRSIGTPGKWAAGEAGTREASPASSAPVTGSAR